MKEGSEPPSSNVLFLLGRIRAPQTPPGCGHCCGVRAVAPPGWTQHSPVHPWHFPTHPGPHLQGRHLPLCCCRAGGGDSRVPYPPGGALAVLPAPCGAAEAAENPGAAPSLPLRHCPRCQSRLPTNPERTWLLVLLEQSLERRDREDLVRSSLPRANPSTKTPAWLGFPSSLGGS